MIFHKLIITITSLIIISSAYAKLAKTELYKIGSNTVLAVLEPNIDFNDLENELSRYNIECTAGMVDRIIIANSKVGVAYKSSRAIKSLPRQGSQRCMRDHVQINILVLGGLKDHYEKYFIAFGGELSFGLFSQRVRAHEEYHAWQDQNAEFIKYIDTLSVGKELVKEVTADVAAVFEQAVLNQDENLNALENQLLVRKNQALSGKFGSQYATIYLHLEVLKRNIIENGGVVFYRNLNSLSKIERMDFYGGYALKLFVTESLK